MRSTRQTTVLSRKLQVIRVAQELSQAAILSIVDPAADPSMRAIVTQWEKGGRVPSREVLIRYAQFANVPLEILLEDDNELPTHISDAAK